MKDILKAHVIIIIIIIIILFLSFETKDREIGGETEGEEWREGFPVPERKSERNKFDEF